VQQLRRDQAFNLPVRIMQVGRNIKEIDTDALVDGRPGHRRLDHQRPRQKHRLGRRADGALLLRKGVIDAPSRRPVALAIALTFKTDRRLDQ
jgi:hypothetical protein